MEGNVSRKRHLEHCADAAHRSAYVPQACQECRRRKLKCNGEQPCSRCHHKGTHCAYGANFRGRNVPETESDEVVSLRRQVQEMQATLQELQTTVQTSSHRDREVLNEKVAGVARTEEVSDGSHAVVRDQAATPFRGPTSAEFSFKVAGGAFSTRELPAVRPWQGDVDRLSNNYGSELLADYSPAAIAYRADPLWRLGTLEVHRLIQVFMANAGVLYPVVEAEQLEHTYQSLQALYAAGDAQKRDAQASMEKMARPAAIALKLVLANASAQESAGINDTVRLLFDSVRRSMERSLWGLPSLAVVVNWILMCLLHFHIDEELQASRAVAHAARLCLELGLHKKDYLRNIAGTSPAAGLSTILLWSTFVLDRRSSIALGIPFVIQDHDVEFSLEKSFTEPRAAHLRNLIALSQISGHACRLADRLSDKSCAVPVDEIDHLDYRVLMFQKHLPEERRFAPADLTCFKTVSRQQRQRLFLNFVVNLRVNQVRNLIYRPILFSPERISTYESHASIAIDVAREALHLLYGLQSDTDLLEKNAMFFKYFLLSAFSTLVLIMANTSDNVASSSTDPSLRLTQRVQNEFHMAVNLFQILGQHSAPIQRLSESIRSLQSSLPSPGIFDQGESHDIPVTAADSTSQNNHAPKLGSVYHTQRDLTALEQHLDPTLTTTFSMQLTNELSTLIDPTSLFNSMDWSAWDA